MSSPVLDAYRAAELQDALRETRIGFHVHALIYVLGITALTLINVLAVPEYYWFWFPLVGWGFGLFMHYWFDYRHAERRLMARQERIARAASL